MDEILGVQIIPLIVNYQIIIYLKKKKFLVEDKVANLYISWSIFSIRAKHWQIFLGMQPTNEKNKSFFLKMFFETKKLHLNNWN